jgi:hypothetical protein
MTGKNPNGVNVNAHETVIITADTTVTVVTVEDKMVFIRFSQE